MSGVLTPVMKRAVLVMGFALALVLLALWASGQGDGVARAAALMQRGVQNAMAGQLRAIRGGEIWAIAVLLGLCFGYGFVHAAGPGHGKVLVASYGVARRIGVWPLALMALAASLAQALTAILLAHGGLWLLGWTRDRLIGTAEGGFVRLAAVMTAGIGVWLIWRGLRAVFGNPLAAGVGRDHTAADVKADVKADGGHVHAPDCGCGHAHGPDPEAVERMASPRDAALLIAAVAARPCSGALLLLVLTWQMGIAAAGIAGAMAMGLGVASVTVVVAIFAVWAREGAIATWPAARLARFLPWVEMAIGLALVLSVTGLLLA